MRILIFNWRDITHPWAGGAELNIHEQAKRWVEMGHQVTLFCGGYEGAPRRESIDGIEVIRRGGRFAVYLWAFIYYLRYFHGKYDVIVDIENGIPFFTPLYTRTPKVCIVHHVHTEQFRKEFAPPLSWIGIFLESIVMPWAYRKVPFITISKSSREELINLGVTPSQCSIVYCGLDHDLYCPDETKTSYPSVLYLGRLMDYKRVDMLIEMLPSILERVPEAVLHILGSGPARPELVQLTQQLSLEEHVVFHGYVSDGEKIGWLQRAWVLVTASMKEGWGLVALEANACGTPVVSFDVPGLCEVVDNPHSGLLVESRKEFSQAVLQLLQNPGRRSDMEGNAVKYASEFSWDKTARRTFDFLTKVCD